MDEATAEEAEVGPGEGVSRASRPSEEVRRIASSRIRCNQGIRSCNSLTESRQLKRSRTRWSETSD